ncbi:aminopeptidase yscIII transferrin receptor [Scheffersomyces coipomensis]|uniref:aminopeptidase yscIII transferrin receptor n=1 Tax=Scheffersomyces coipomensis TaxID=1788519 RepID=UPI00315DBACD
MEMSNYKKPLSIHQPYLSSFERHQEYSPLQVIINMKLHSFTLIATLAIFNVVNSLPVDEQAILNLNNPASKDGIIPYVNEYGHDHKGEEDNDEQIDIMSEVEYNQLPLVETEALQALINEPGLKSRAHSLFDIAQRSVKKYGHPTRVIGSKGHWGTIDYIKSEIYRLRGYYTVKTQAFSAIDGKVNSYSLLIDGIKPKSLEALSLTPPTPNGKPVHGNLVLIDGFGCSLSDYPANLTAGNIALVKRGECAFGDKSINAGKSGAVGAIIFDNLPLHGTLGTPTGDEVPTVSITEKDALDYIKKLTEDPSYKFETTLYVDSVITNITTLNVIAETRFGDHDNVVSLGAHSDSVTEGPGINDDGSGTISLLEVAKELTKFKVKNAVRFAWWAAEEEGLLGSDYYANSLNEEENSKVRLFMDYDMMASPNYEYEVYDANNEDHPNGSGTLKDLYIDWYTSHGLNYTLVPFDGRSDYVGFIDNGIPAGGIATGAEGVKTKEGEEKFGGKAGDWFDPCYHQLCDDLSNPDYEAWVINTKLIAHSVATYAESFDGFPIREKSTTISTNEQSPKKVNNFKYHGSRLII